MLFHGVIAILLTRETWIAFPSRATLEPLTLFFLNANPPAHGNVTAVPRALPPRITEIKPAPLSDGRIPTPDNYAISTEPPPTPPIDWTLEAELAAKDSLAKAEKEKNFRNLAGLSAGQLEWVRRNHMEPTTSHIEWNHPRFELDRSTGLPVLWINDHCVMVTVMVFCAVGHVETNGNVFKDMREHLHERLTDPLP
jgi:hypothetical protein